MKAGGQIGIEGTLCHQSTWCCVPLSLSPTMTTEVAVNAVPINFNINNELTLLAWFFASLALKPRYRLNRGGDRAANSALHIIAIGRLRTDAKTKEYVARRVAEGHTKMEAIRCLKRYISREVYTLLRNQNRRINSIPITA